MPPRCPWLPPLPTGQYPLWQISCLLPPAFTGGSPLPRSHPSALRLSASLQAPPWTLLSGKLLGSSSSVPLHLPPPPSPGRPFNHCPLDILVPWLSCQALLQRQLRGEANQQRPPLPPFLSSCQTPDKVFSPSFPALNGLILFGRLAPLEPPPQAGREF